MWLMTRYGFFSAVSARKQIKPRKGDKGARYGKRLDKNRIMVRARVREHLEALRGRFHKLIGGADILESEAADYRYRIIIKRAHWIEIATELATEIEYGNFKDECKKNVNQTGWDYINALMRTWGTMYGLQQGRTASSMFDDEEGIDDFFDFDEDDDGDSGEDGNTPVLISA